MAKHRAVPPTASLMTTPPAVPAVVAVLGGITRDNFDVRFNPRWQDRFTCPLQQDRTSLISLMSAPVDASWEPIGAMEEEHRRSVDAELDKSFLAAVAQLQPDYVILDLFADAYCGVARLDRDTYVTDDRSTLRRTDLYRRWIEKDRLTRLKLVRDADRYVPLWRSAFDAFERFARERLPSTALVLHRGRFTDAIRLPGSVRPQSLRDYLGAKRRIPVRRSNRLWAQLDDYAAERVDAVIDLTDEDYPTFPEHPGGPFYTNYAMAYYPRFLARLEAIDDRLLRRR